MILRELKIKECKKRIDALGINEYNVGKISEYALRMYEVEAEYMTLVKRKGEKL